MTFMSILKPLFSEALKTSRILFPNLIISSIEKLKGTQQATEGACSGFKGAICF